MSDSIPNTPQIIYSNTSNNIVKIAEPQYILIKEDEVSIEIMNQLIFEDIGSQEIINIDRNDTVFGSNLLHNPISNNDKILQTYNSYTLAPIYQTSQEYFKNFPINYNEKLPSVANGEDGSNIYIDSTTGDLILEFINLESDEQIEVNILNAGTGYYDTI